MSEDEISVLHSDDNDSIEVLPDYTSELPKIQPICIRGHGSITIFGLNSHFDEDEFPLSLTGKVAPEELEHTLRSINKILRHTVPWNFRWFLCGIFFCCCTLGCSLWPVVFLNKRTICAIEKTLDFENNRLYHKLGLHWKLAKQQLDNNSYLSEYVLLLEIIPKIPLLIPD
uniref:Cysteine-rich hydrophobic protein (projected from Caenorhabditis elegans ortholog tag-266) n=2 Tax=Strongyloides TaxID=6247 RepID=A0A0K0G1M1_STRVS